MVVSAPRRVQLGRVLRRPGMTRERLAGIEARQLPDLVKRARADTVIDTGLGRRHSLQAIRRAVTLLRRRTKRRACAQSDCED
jgi:dephospho-CoA kinase